MEFSEVSSISQIKDDWKGYLALVAAGTAMIVFYLLPAFVAYGNRHPSRDAVLLVNLMFGWTVLGWLLSLVWACVGRKAKADLDS